MAEILTNNARKAVRNDGRHAPVPGRLSDETDPGGHHRPGRPYGVIKTGNCDGTVQHGYYPERETADRGVENRINGGTLYAGVLPCDVSGIPDHRI